MLFFLAIILLGYGTWWLGEWQFGRLEDRKERNAVVAANEDRTPSSPSPTSSRPGGPCRRRTSGGVVTATGVYDAAETVVVRYRTRKSAPGVEVVVPLRDRRRHRRRWWTAGGSAPTTPRSVPTTCPPRRRARSPSPAGCARTVTGDSTEIVGHSTRAISSTRIGEAIDVPVFTGFVALKSEDPAPAEELEPVELPELGEGPHFFYGLQWWFFGVLGVGGFAYLAWDERRNGRRGERRPQRARGPFSRRTDAEDEPGGSQRPRDIPPSTGTITPDRNEAAGDSRNAAT